MCGRYTVLTEDEIIEVRSLIQALSLRLARDEAGHEAGHDEEAQEIAPTNRAPIVTSDGNTLAFELGRFGFAKWDGKGVIINARAETVKEKSMFQHYLKTGRCIVPASGYYEWKQSGEDRQKKKKHLIKDKADNLLFMAGLWRDGKDGREFVIITKEPYGDVKDIHDRMPVILRADQLEAWLSGDMPIEALATLDFDCVGEPSEETDRTKAGDGGQMRLFTP